VILSLVTLTPAPAPADRLQGCVFAREFLLRIKRRGVETRFAIEASDPRATNPDPVLLTEVKRARRWVKLRHYPPLLRRLAASVQWPT
jgi:hypothetical protein